MVSNSLMALKCNCY